MPKINNDSSIRDKSISISDRLYTLEPVYRKEEIR